MLFYDVTMSRIKMAAAFLCRVQKEDGLFLYEYDFLTGKEAEVNNIVRQAGAGYALAEYYAKTRDHEVGEKIRKAIQAYSSRSVAHENGYLVTRNRRISTARSGATALALLTEMLYSHTSGTDHYQDIREQWLKGLIDCRISDKGFMQSPEDAGESPYFNGEIWLALAWYENLYPGDQRVLEILKSLDNYLVEKYGEKFDIAFFHWGVMAAAQRFKATGDTVLKEFIVAMVREFMEKSRPRVKSHVNSCYSVEGLATALHLLSADGGDAGLMLALKERIRKEMKKNVGFQITPQTLTVPLRKGCDLFCDELNQFNGAFLNGMYRPQVRIDFTQHALSAMLLSEELAD